jgi:hypothetical protein
VRQSTRVPKTSKASARTAIRRGYLLAIGIRVAA